MLFEKFYTVSFTWEASVIIEAKNANEAEEIFRNEFDGQDIEPNQVPPEAGIFIEPLTAKPIVFRKDLIEPGEEDNVFILRCT